MTARKEMAEVVVQRLASDGRYIGIVQVMGPQSMKVRPLICVRVSDQMGQRIGDVFISQLGRRSTSPRMPIVQMVANVTHRAALADILGIPDDNVMVESQRCVAVILTDPIYESHREIGWDSTVSTDPYMDIVFTLDEAIIGYGAVVNAATPACVLREFGDQTQEQAIAALLA